MLSTATDAKFTAEDLDSLDAFYGENFYVHIMSSVKSGVSR